MEPYRKAEQIMQHFCIQVGQITQRGQIACARAYIAQFLEDVATIEGDFKLTSKGHWPLYTSYWYAVLLAINSRDINNK